MPTIERRLLALEASLGDGNTGRFPVVVDDDTPPEKIAQLRKRGREVLTFGQMVDACVMGDDHADH